MKGNDDALTFGEVRRVAWEAVILLFAIYVILGGV